MKRRYTLSLGIVLFYSYSASAALSATTSATIQGTAPRFVTSIENKMDDFDLLGFEYKDYTNDTTFVTQTYYGDSDLTKLAFRSAYPFHNLFSAAAVKQPNATQFLDTDGDTLDKLVTTTPLTLEWYYTDAASNDVKFEPKSADTLCKLTESNKFGPYKIKISANLKLTSVYGDPAVNVYPNTEVTTSPSKTYTVAEGAGFCYAKASLAPSDAKSSANIIYDKNKGFLVQSPTNGERNFPRTGFYNAFFWLDLPSTIKTADFDWEVKGDGKSLINISTGGSTVTVKFNTADAGNTKKAHGLVVPSGADIVIEGVNKANKKYKITYPMNIKSWFSGWKGGNFIPTSAGSVTGDLTSSAISKNVYKSCQALPPAGKYRLAYGSEVSNATLGSDNSKVVLFTREIGVKLFSEWGSVTKDTYPGSFGYNNSGASGRFWVWNTQVNEYCDIHVYNAKYHCRGENEDKNAVCIAIP